MRNLIILGIIFLLVSCSAAPRRAGEATADTTGGQPVPRPAGEGQSAPAAIKENMSMIGAVLRSIDMVDSMRYVLTLELRTVLPAGNAESLAESGQMVTVYPDYVTGPDGGIFLDNERNKRLREIRSIKPGESVIGRITLRQDGKWYLFDSGLE